MWRRLQIVDTGPAAPGTTRVSSSSGSPISATVGGVLHERSRFRPGRRQVVYVDGDISSTDPRKVLALPGTAATGWFAVAALDWGEYAPHPEQQLRQFGPADFFTGEVYFDVIAKVRSHPDYVVNTVRFAPCARTAWLVTPTPAVGPCT